MTVRFLFLPCLAGYTEEIFYHNKMEMISYNEKQIIRHSSFLSGKTKNHPVFRFQLKKTKTTRFSNFMFCFEMEKRMNKTHTDRISHSPGMMNSGFQLPFPWFQQGLEVVSVTTPCTQLTSA